jgi:hypothetical protein
MVAAQERDQFLMPLMNKLRERTGLVCVTMHLQIVVQSQLMAKKSVQWVAVLSKSLYQNCGGCW